MKKGKCLLILSVGIFIVGCRQGISNLYDNERNSYSDFTKKCLDITDLQTDAANKGIEIVSKYIDIGTPSSRNLNNETVDFDFIGSLLPDDLTLLKRTKLVVGEKRSLGACEIETNLENELNEVVYEFKNSITQLVPDPSAALSLGYVTGSETGIKISDDTEIPYDSIEGIVTVELLNAVANGQDLQAVITELENVSECNEVNSRALWKTSSTSKWVKGYVNYRWGSISEEHKEAMVNAMSTWNKKTEGKVCFNEFENTGWNKFQLGLCVIGCITISDEKTNKWNGLATVGYVSGPFGYLKLRDVITEDALTRTSLHELGHTLGLSHEHQRYDRDDYIYVTDSNHNYDKIEKDITGCRWASKNIRIGWWTITLWYPCWWTQTNSEVCGTFDFDSVMLYSGFEIKSPYNTKENGIESDNKYYTRYNIEFSDNDIKMIKNKY